jgi:uncharacterized protein (PEP-CTERM system associated)
LDYSNTNKGSTLARTSLPGEGSPTFQWAANASLSESYTTNSAGLGGQSQPDYLTTLGFSGNAHEHTRSLSFDANYNFLGDFYANGTVPTQLSNYLQAMGSAQIIPDYLNFNLRAFAQPVDTSGLGTLTAGNREIPGAYSNSYGYYASPDLTFRFGDFASSETLPSYSQAFFSAPNGTTAANTIPGLRGPEDTTMRSVTENITSGPDFGRFRWTLVGLLSETNNANSLLTEKNGTANVQYAIDYEWSLIFTGGYDFIGNSIPLIENVSAPFALAGFGLKMGTDFTFQIEAGERYNKFSLTSDLQYSITPTSHISASVNDYIQTPEGQLINSLGTFTGLSSGSPNTVQNIITNGTNPSLGSINAQYPGNALDQQLSRYQTGTVAWAEQLERNSITFSLFGTRRTYLTSGFIGPETGFSWGSNLLFSRSFTPLLNGSLAITYNNDQELGGFGKTITAYGTLNYALSRTTSLSLQSSYLTRSSSQSLQALSPLTGDASDFMITLGITHAF